MTNLTSKSASTAKSQQNATPAMPARRRVARKPAPTASTNAAPAAKVLKLMLRSSITWTWAVAEAICRTCKSYWFCVLIGPFGVLKLKRNKLGSGTHCERWLQALIFDHPELLLPKHIEGWIAAIEQLLADVRAAARAAVG